MKIEAITLREIHMPLVHFFETSFGRIHSRRILLVQVRCDGVGGWAESVAGEDPFYSSEWIDSAWSTMKHFLAPALLGKSIDSARDSGALMARVRGHRMAKAALENAIWDAEGARGVYLKNHIAREYRNLCTATRHVTHNWDGNAAAHGRVKLGLPLDNPSL